jgi:hypothetical protein
MVLLGFPPPDQGLRGWLLTVENREDQAGVAQKMHAFITSLLTVTLCKLKELSGDKIVLVLRMAC